MNKKLHVWSRHLRGKPKKLKSFLTGYLAAILYFPGKVEALLISAYKYTYKFFVCVLICGMKSKCCQKISNTIFIVFSYWSLKSMWNKVVYEMPSLAGHDGVTCTNTPGYFSNVTQCFSMFSHLTCPTPSLKSLMIGSMQEERSTQCPVLCYLSFWSTDRHIAQLDWTLPSALNPITRAKRFLSCWSFYRIILMVTLANKIMLTLIFASLKILEQPWLVSSQHIR